MDLHYIDGSPFARIVRVLAREHSVSLREIEIVEFPPPDTYLQINPLGQVPALVEGHNVYFPTRITIEVLLSRVERPSADVAVAIARPRHRTKDDQDLAVILAMGDALAAHHYAHWAGIGSVEYNRLGFDPAQRNMVRVLRTLDWLESRMKNVAFQPGSISIQDIALCCFILWSESRGPIAWRGRTQIEQLIMRLEERPSFRATIPRPHRLREPSEG